MLRDIIPVLKSIKSCLVVIHQDRVIIHPPKRHYHVNYKKMLINKNIKHPSKKHYYDRHAQRINYRR